MKKFLIKMGYYSGLAGGVLKLRRGGGFRVLMYHHILPEENPFLPGVTRKVFFRQIKYLQRAYRIMDLGDLVLLLKERKSIPPRSLALTFDDGYEDFYQQAFPLLKSLSLPATVFVATGFIDTDLVPWTDELRILFRKTSQNRLEIKDGAGERYSWNDEASKLRALRRVKGSLKALPEEERLSRYREIKARLKVEPAGETRILTRRQIREMAAAGVSFGGHTVHHTILTKINPAAARDEIV